jgi:hypothetical protein
MFIPKPLQSAQKAASWLGFAGEEQVTAEAECMLASAAMVAM